MLNKSTGGGWAVAAALANAAFAQSQPTVGLPSLPFTATAQAQNGGAGPQVTYQYGIEFVTIPGGTEYYGGGGPYDVPWLPGVGRGAVAQAFRIGRYEVGTASWRAFVYAAEQVRVSTGQPIPWAPNWVSASGGQYARTSGTWWEAAAVYCNWLHNDQALTREAFMSGAYDVSMFGSSATQQPTRSPGARFWIPSVDEWLRAGYFDPNHNSPQYGNWWQYGHASDAAPWPGLPTQFGEANYGFEARYGEHLSVPLGAYPHIQSPWGLFDVNGANAEWTEEIWTSAGDLGPRRFFAGSHTTSRGNPMAYTVGGSVGGDIDPWTFWTGLRIAAVVPTPSSGALALGALWLLRQRCR